MPNMAYDTPLDAATGIVTTVQVPPMPASQARAVIEEELGGLPLEEVFEWIDLDEPLGSASIAQVLLQGRTL